MTKSKGMDWGPWAQGVLASAVGAGAAAYVARRLSEPLGVAVGEAFGPVAAEVAIGALVMGGMTLGVAPGVWLAGRRHVRWARSAAMALPLSGAVGGAAGLGTWAAVGTVAGPGVAAAAGSLAGLAAFGAGQYVAVSRCGARPGWWAAASVASLLAAFVATILLAFAMGDAASGQGFGGAAFGAGYAAVSGSLLASGSGRRRDGHAEVDPLRQG